MSGSRLDRLLLGFADTAALSGIVVSGLTLNSRDARPGVAFVALRGTRQHGIDFAADAVARGAVAVIADAPAPQDAPALDVPVVWVDGLAEYVGEIAARFYRHPSQELRVVGVTGTNGKTSTVQLVAQALHRLGHRAASIGTLGAGLVGQLREGERTTPDAISVRSTGADPTVSSER